MNEVYRINYKTGIHETKEIDSYEIIQKRQIAIKNRQIAKKRKKVS